MPDKAIILARRRAAVSALGYFEQYSVKSGNNPFDDMFDSAGKKHTSDIIARSRMKQPMNATNIAQSNYDTMNNGMGNCNEKAALCYSSLKSSPHLFGPNHHVTMVGAIGYDHAFCVVSDAPITPNTSFSQLGKTAMIVDGWTEDWYFPNLNFKDRVLGSAITIPNPRQSYIRIKTRHHRFSPVRTIDTPTTRINKR